MTDSELATTIEQRRIPFLKRLTDVVLAMLLTLLCLPLWIVIPLAIKLSGIIRPEDRGTVLRHEVRYSGKQPFDCYKFRVIKASVLEEEPLGHGLVRAKTLEGDANCTAVGKWIKKWYLDELPQLLHILQGRMSLVGPRPFRVEDYGERRGREGVEIRTARAGLTGLLQSYKGIPTTKSTHELEMEYIRMSQTLSSFQLWRYDTGILLRTIRVFLQAKGI
tara:strand:- start:10876 stop:11535 length:660 start_codon:yes stop_codon:yes gene_type:complete